MSSFSVWFEKLPLLENLEFQINPIAFTVFGKSIAWYGILICLGMIAAYLISSRKATKQEGFSSDDFLDYILLVVPAGIIGARAFYVVTNLDHYPDFMSMIAVWEGGLAITGGILFGILAIIAVSLVKKKNCLRLLDAAAPGVLVAQAIGRWGNFFNGEVFGVETSLPWGMSLRMGVLEYLNRHPLFLYESLLNLVGFALIMIFYKKKRFHGQHVFFYLLWYGAVRSLLEPLRDVSYQLKISLFGAELLFSQVFSLAILVLGVAAMIVGFVLKDKKIFALEQADAAASQEEGEPDLDAREEESEDSEEAAEESAPSPEAEAAEPSATPEEQNAPQLTTNEKENDHDPENS